ncbi:MAG: NAD(P)H-binding protein [Nannocystaceae bacterium]
MRVTVVGANGLCGRSVCRRLAAAGHQAIAIQRRGTATEANELRLSTIVEGTIEALAEALAGAEAIVNLVGIKRGDDAAFEAAHLEVPRRLCAAAEVAGIRRLIHISVAGCRDAADSPYLRTKAAGEAIVRGSGLEVTILRLGVVHGDGDDLLRNLAAMLLHAPIFPAPGGGRGELQPIAADEVGLAVVRALERPATAGATLDVVGPERLPLRSLVRRVAGALELPVAIVGAPTSWMRPAAAVMERVLADPPITRSQLRLLADGVVGDPAPARAALGFEPSALDEATIRRICADARPWLGVSLRPFWIADRGRIEAFAAGAPRAAALLPLALGLPLGLCAGLSDLWRAMPLSYAIVTPAVLVAIPRALRGPARAWVRVTGRALIQGVIAAAALYGLGAATLAIARAITPAIAGPLADVYALAAAAPGSWTLPLLVLTIVGEEVVWRGAILLPLAAKIGPWSAVVIAALLYAAAHALAGPPLLAGAALGAGLFWGWLTLRSGSLFAAIVCHLLWDLAVVLVAPYT